MGGLGFIFCFAVDPLRMHNPSKYLSTLPFDLSRTPARQATPPPPEFHTLEAQTCAPTFRGGGKQFQGFSGEGCVVLYCILKVSGAHILACRHGIGNRNRRSTRREWGGVRVRHTFEAPARVLTGVGDTVQCLEVFSLFLKA